MKSEYTLHVECENKDEEKNFGGDNNEDKDFDGSDGKRFVSLLSWATERNEREETGEKVVTGMGKTRKDAQQQAAENALRSLDDKYVTCIISQAKKLNKHPDNQPTKMESGFLCETDSDEDGENSSEVSTPIESTHQALFSTRRGACCLKYKSDTAKALNRIPHHLSDSIRQRLSLEHIHLGKCTQVLSIHTLRIWPRLRMGFCGISVYSTYRSARMAQNCMFLSPLLDKNLQLQQEPFPYGSETEYTTSVLSPQMLKHMHQMRDSINLPFSHLTDHE
uniref:RNA polymerase II C-terminal domain phosphatase-like 2 isoform X2 n=1 Tax=Tanacetum cinerariifolium TaxID=118510 RepID=A0A699I033_TANCI|nr:RNA polymerase II C-terminal domain phosphatase-like 2 isoform X2 [Tanacetum cinerariifolium]